MIHPLLLCLLATLALAAEWTPIFVDEFDRDGAPDPAKWTYEEGFVRNRELQWYQPQNALCKDGLLVIEARRETRPNPTYDATSKDWRHQRPEIAFTSACLISQGRFSFTYGRAEIRARIDTRPGSWPAFWTLGVEQPYPENGEIDIMEYYQGTLLANVFYGFGGKLRESVTKYPLRDFGGEAWAKEFHVWAMEWDPERIVLTLDGKVLNTFRVAVDDEPGKPNAFRKPHYLLINQAIGGNAGGDPGATVFPVRLEVDWVRVSQRKE
jgi:beta-glucanase (GH16 family)